MKTIVLLSSLGSIKSLLESNGIHVKGKIESDSEVVICRLNQAKEVKLKYPQSTLIVVDSSENELKDLFLVKANLWISPHKKMAYTSDGSEIGLNDGGISLILKLIKSSWFKTVLVNDKSKPIKNKELSLLSLYPKEIKEGYIFGTIAIKRPQGFLTTSRGKTVNDKKNLVWVQSVDFTKKIVYVNQKASLNAPLLGKVFKQNPKIKYIIHGHDLTKGDNFHQEYEFPGTLGDLKNSPKNKSQFVLKLPYHGYLAGFSDLKTCKNFCLWEQYRKNFPRRYIEEGVFDQFIKDLSDSAPLKVLDVGGGELGTLSLNKPNFKVYGLDPNVISKPDFYVKKINWGFKEKFDLIVLRGSINYLKKSEILFLIKQLNPKGRLIANSFRNPPSNKITSREFETLEGVKGQERVKLVGNKVWHELNIQGDSIIHEFFYRSLSFWKKTLPGINVIENNKNSIILDYQKKT